MRFDHYLFDFDGTIADTGEGIRRCVAYSLERLGKPVPGKDILNRFIGPPLHDSYEEQCGLTDAETARALEYYRERYWDVGLYESHLYPGIAELLKALREGGAHVGLASAKPQTMVETLCSHFGITSYIDTISGTALIHRHSADKRDLLLKALPPETEPARVCMAGDRRFDIEAARALHMFAVGADYGYAQPGELLTAGADIVFPTVDAMAAWMLA